MGATDLLHRYANSFSHHRASPMRCFGRRVMKRQGDDALSRLVAKRLEHIPNRNPPRMKIVSDNDRYAPYERLIVEMNIVGRMRWLREKFEIQA